MNQQKPVKFCLSITPHTHTNQKGQRVVAVEKRQVQSTRYLAGKITKPMAQGKMIPKFVKDKQLQQIEKDYLTLLAFHRPKVPLDGPLYLEIKIVFPWHEGDSKETRALGEVPHDTKPDIDNWLKTFKDCLAKAGFFTNDSRIVDLYAMKRRGDKPRIDVRIEPYLGEG